MERMEMDLGFATLVVERGADKDYKEIFIGLEDKDGMWIQDIAVIGQKYHYDEDCEVVHDKGINVLVYADANNEDYTHEFKIDIYEEKN